MVDFQQIAVYGIVGVAAATLVRHAVKSVKSADAGHCEGCGECGRPAKAHVRPAPKATPLVTLSTGSPPRRFTAPKPGGDAS